MISMISRVKESALKLPSSFIDQWNATATKIKVFVASCLAALAALFLSILCCRPSRTNLNRKVQPSPPSASPDLRDIPNPDLSSSKATYHTPFRKTHYRGPTAAENPAAFPFHTNPQVTPDVKGSNTNPHIPSFRTTPYINTTDRKNREEDLSPPLPPFTRSPTGGDPIQESLNQKSKRIRQSYPQRQPRRGGQVGAGRRV